MSTLLMCLATAQFFAVLVFMATYHILAPWWRTETGPNVTGRNVMALSACLLGWSVLRVATGVFGPTPTPPATWPLQDLVRLVLYAGMLVVIVHRWVLLLRAQAAGNATRDGQA